ncbi:VanZ family protein [Geosporobacter ferrireducens]|uniref:VanZ family protein n=1 Tax=Geosporobacter ferrireducens TaxID=1424294 RepID=A0A1D8GGS5_9FIRM|nr:VanZ family protein [Geosporobacter ferrireducens]AOT70122.1 VanZ family protein [Geosporobacter ferrireducens]
MHIFRDKKQKGIILSWTAVLLWMLLIFLLSAQPAQQSNQLSKGLTGVIIETAEKVTSSFEININRFNHLLRKNAHFFAYLILGVLVINAFRKSEVVGVRGVVLTLVICVIYAISDELHQLFVPGRGGQLRDVLIDSAGVIVGIIIYQRSSKI